MGLYLLLTKPGGGVVKQTWAHNPVARAPHGAPLLLAVSGGSLLVEARMPGVLSQRA